MIYNISNAVAVERLAGPFEKASDALARLDERLRASPLGEAYIIRAHFQDACAALWRQGEFVQIEDLVLRDAGMDVRAPTHELVRAERVLSARRRIASQPPAWALTEAGIDALRGLQTSRSRDLDHKTDREDDGCDEAVDEGAFYEDEYALAAVFDEIDAVIARTSATTNAAKCPRRDDSGLVYDEDWDEDRLLAQWRAALDETETMPPLIAAALAYDAWETIEPLQHQGWLGALLAGAVLRARGKTRHHLASLYVGFRHMRGRRSRLQDLTTRLVGFAEAAETTAALGMKEIERLSLSRELLMRKCAGRRKNSKLPQLVDLCLRLPIISAPLAAKELGVSQQAAATMIDELSSNLRELTERRRYRCWAII
ncbi:MAG: DUF1612 domain-containing protein [Hyphomicrobiales bacterium]|nr:MAG: DUF1612 domain-containing protein [Hyphomicrobiales bacterium]